MIHVLRGALLYDRNTSKLRFRGGEGLSTGLTESRDCPVVLLTLKCLGGSARISPVSPVVDFISSPESSPSGLALDQQCWERNGPFRAGSGGIEFCVDSSVARTTAKTWHRRDVLIRMCSYVRKDSALSGAVAWAVSP